jgi:hypothetical protein
LDRRWSRSRSERIIAAPAAAIWEVVSDHAERTSWYPACDSFEPLDAQTSGVGATFAEKEWLWTSTSEIAVWDEHERIGWNTTTLNFPGLLSGLYTELHIDDRGESSLVSLTAGFSFGLLGWLLVAYTYPQMFGTLFVDHRSALRRLEQIVTTA